MKTLIIALVLTPLLNFATSNTPQEASRLPKPVVEEAKSAGKLILIISQSHAGTATSMLENRHISQFLHAHFIIEQQANPYGRDEYLVYNQQQALVHRVAHEPYPYELAVKIKRALDPHTQYYTLLSRFEKGERSAELLKNLIIGASDAADREHATRFMQAYLTTQESAVTPDNIRFLATHTKTSDDPGFAILLTNMAAADDVLGAGKTAEKLSAIIFEEAFASRLDDKKVDLEALTTQVKVAYPNQSLAVSIDRMPVELLEMREDWESLKSALPAYLEAHGEQLSAAIRDYYGWLAGEYLGDSE